MCQHGNVLRSSALLFNEDRFQEELVRERTGKDLINNQNSISPAKSSDSDENKIPPSKLVSPKEKSSLSKGQTYYLGDFVYIEPTDEKNEPIIICIESFDHQNNEDYLTGLQFFRPDETYHTPTQKFLRQEVFLTQTIEHIPMNKIQGLCYVLHVKDYFKYQPILDDETQFSEEDIYVCESRYNIKTKMFKKIKWWNVPENKRVKLIQRDIPLENIRIPSTLVNHLMHRSSTADNESANIDIIEKTRETILYDLVINDKLNENSSIKRDFYEQIVLSINQFYKVGDFVYVNNIDNQMNKKFILRIDKIWKDNK
jgi:protein polybromo-1